MIVADASAVVEALLDAESPAYELIGEGTIHAPDLVGLEVLHALRRLARRGFVGPARATAAATDLARLRLVRHPHRELEPRIWSLRDVVSTYDAAYVALAESVGASIVTADGRLARAAGNLVSIHLIDRM